MRLRQLRQATSCPASLSRLAAPAGNISSHPSLLSFFVRFYSTKAEICQSNELMAAGAAAGPHKHSACQPAAPPSAAARPLQAGQLRGRGGLGGRTSPQDENQGKGRGRGRRRGSARQVARRAFPWPCVIGGACAVARCLPPQLPDRRGSSLQVGSHLGRQGLQVQVAQLGKRPRHRLRQRRAQVEAGVAGRRGAWTKAVRQP